MNTIIYAAICIVSLAIVIYVAIFLLWIMRLFWEYLQDEVLSDPASKFFVFVVGGLFSAGVILWFLGL